MIKGQPLKSALSFHLLFSSLLYLPDWGCRVLRTLCLHLHLSRDHQDLQLYALHYCIWLQRFFNSFFHAVAAPLIQKNPQTSSCQEGHISIIKSHGFHRIEKFPKMQGFSKLREFQYNGTNSLQTPISQARFFLDFLDLSQGSVVAMYKRNYYSYNCHGT